MLRLLASWEPLGGYSEPPQHSGILEESIILTVGRPVSYDAGIRGKPLGGFP